MAKATNKTYVVYGAEGEELETLKTLAAAKKLADTEHGTVLCDGECVYKAAVQEAEEPAVEETAEPVETSPEEVERAVAQKTQHFRLKTLMNVRKGPTTSSARLKTLPAGTVVDVREVKNDWLCLTDGSFILFGAGRFAERV